MKFIKKFMFSNRKYFIDEKYQNFSLTAPNHPGSLHRLTSVFANQGINLTYLKTHMGNVYPGGLNAYTMSVSIDKQPKETIEKLRSQFIKIGIVLQDLPIIAVPWFPRNLKELDYIGLELQKPQEENNKDHPGFQDPQYRKRRDRIAQIAQSYKMGDKIPNVDYTPQETKVWCSIYAKLKVLHQKAMSERVLKQIQKLQKNFKIDKRIPQLDQLNQYLKSQTGFMIKPTSGILSQRQFLNSFAFKTFCSTQYLRHHMSPDYTPQPDIVHEIVGHIPVFADPDVAELSHKIGLLSLGASDQQIAQLGTLYWFTLQFGACKEGNSILGYGAGIASSIGQIEHFLSNKPKFQKLKLLRDCNEQFPIQTVQPIYKYTESFHDCIKELEDFGKNITKAVTTSYNFITNSIQYDRNIQATYLGDKGPKF